MQKNDGLLQDSFHGSPDGRIQPRQLAPQLKAASEEKFSDFCTILKITPKKVLLYLQAFGKMIQLHFGGRPVHVRVSTLQ